MEMLATSRILADLVLKHVESARAAERDSRLLLPGPTRKIARQVHHCLLEQRVNSYLVIGEDEEPSEEGHLIRPAGLTSKRIGSFVAVVCPGQLAHIQDSIRGSGGTIRSMAFSEEWPWIDDGNEAFRFDGPVLGALVEGWSTNTGERRWLRELVLEALVAHTRSSSRRATILLEEILGVFEPGLYPDVPDVRRKLLLHAGIPLPPGELPAVRSLVRDTDRLRQKILARSQREEDLRAQATDLLPEVFDGVEVEAAKASLDFFLDGIGSTTTDLGVLGFYGCWGPDRSDTTHWRRLDAGKLAALFGVMDEDEASVSVSAHCARGLCSSDGGEVATFVGERLRLDVTYEIPPAQWSAGEWALQVRNRQTVLVDQPVAEPLGPLAVFLDTGALGVRHVRKIPLRVVLVAAGDVQAYARLDVHLCGRDRPAFVISQPFFEVVDARPVSGAESADRKMHADKPLRLFLFSHGDVNVEVIDHDGETVDLVATGMEDIQRTAHELDARREPGGVTTRICRFGELEAVLSFEADELEEGEFTLEDELRVAIAGEARVGRLGDLVEAFRGRRGEPYRALGGLDQRARRRIALASQMATRSGWRPVLTNFFEPDQETPGTVGDFVARAGPVEAGPFGGLSLESEALHLLRAYADARDTVRQTVESTYGRALAGIDHPAYAACPIFAEDRAERTDDLLAAYLDAYDGILQYVGRAREALEWGQLFVLAHVDCAVHWDNSRLRNAFFLIGPWHPLVVAKRFMVQAALYARAQRLASGEDGKALRRLARLLGGVQGFRWLLGLSADDRLLEPAYVTVTSDPGWHFAFKTETPDLAAGEPVGSLLGIVEVLRRNLGLAAGLAAQSDSNLVTTCLSNYMRAFPARRSVGIRVRKGYVPGDVLHALDSHVHAEDDGATDQGKELPGGVRLYFEDSLDEAAVNGGGIRWSNPPLYAYRFEDDNDCLREGHPDIYMLPPATGLSFTTTPRVSAVPRGQGRGAVFSTPVRLLTEGHTLVPKSISLEFDRPCATADGVGDAFKTVTGQIGALLGNCTAAVCSVDLPQRLGAPWVAIPGQLIDPATLVKYVRDGTDRGIEHRALWDYTLDVAGGTDSYYVLSSIPKSFQVAVSGFFGRDDIAGDFVAELGRIGIAIGGEALRSGRRALGVIGLVGAVRMLVGGTAGRRPALACDDIATAVLVPVDSFASFFGKTGLGDGKRTDLLAILLGLPVNGSARLRVSACGVESKFVSGSFCTARAQAALQQAGATCGEFKGLVKASLREGGMPERLALLEILRFGMRIASPSQATETDAWARREAQVFEALLGGNYEYVEATQGAVVFSTEGQLPGVAEHRVLDGGIWVRLTKGHWPGLSETPQLDTIREALSALFILPPDNSARPAEAPVAPACRKGEETAGSPYAAPDAPGGKETPPDVGPGTPGSASPEPGEGELAGRHDHGASIAAEGPGPLSRILLGVDEARREVTFDPQSPVDPLDNMNVMVTGSPGSGKTQLLKYLICRLREQDKNTLILDMKNDFASDGTFCDRARLEKVYVTFDGLPFNPLIPYPVRHPETGELYVQPGQHIAGVAAVLKQAYGLGAQQQAAVKNAVVGAFADAGVPTSGVVPFSQNLACPDFSQVGETLQRDNPAAYNRLDPLFTLGLFRAEFRRHSFHGLVSRAAVLDLSQIPSDAIKNTLAQLIVLAAHAYFNAQPHSGTIRQFFIFDEAHRVLKSDYMLRLARECRAYGIGTVLSSQYPSDFPAEISSAMATKIIHGNGKDVERVKAIVQLLGCEGREDEVGSLERFQCIIDNRHHPSTTVRTLSYPLYLVLLRLRQLGTATRDEIGQTEGVDPTKLPVVNLIRGLEMLGLAEERDGRVHLLERAR